MSTKSGRPYSIEAVMEKHLADILQTMMEDRKKRDSELLEGRKRHEATVECLLARLDTVASRPLDPASLDTRPTLSKLTEEDDIEAYLTTFERMMEGYSIDKGKWSYKLAPNLTGRAQQAFAALPSTDVGNYDKLKEAILARYNANQETYRQRFRSSKRKLEESHEELVIRLSDLCVKWTKDCHTVSDIRQMIVMEQFLNSLAPEFRLRVKERDPKTVQDAAKIADHLLQAKKQERSWYQKKESSEGEREIRCFGCGQTGHIKRLCPNVFNDLSERKNPTVEDKALKNQPTTSAKAGITCFNCKRKGHYASECPQDALCGVGQIQSLQSKVFYQKGTVEGTDVSDIVLDTGCSQTLVRKELVPEDKITQEQAVTIRCAHGDLVLYPTAVVDLEVAGESLTVKVAVSSTLPMSVLLGTDVQLVADLIPENALAVITRHRLNSSNRF